MLAERGGGGSFIFLPVGGLKAFRRAGRNVHKEPYHHASGLDHFHAPDDQSQGTDHGFGQTDDGFFEGVFAHVFLTDGALKARPGKSSALPQGQKRGPIQATPL